MWTTQYGDKHVKEMAPYRTVVDRLRSGSVYPSVGSDGLTLSHVFPVPNHYNGNESTIVFRYSSPLAAAVTMLNDASLTDENTNNFAWDPGTAV